LTKQTPYGIMLKEQNCSNRTDQMEIPKYRCVGPVQQDPVNHVRRETEQH